MNVIELSYFNLQKLEEFFQDTDLLNSEIFYDSSEDVLVLNNDGSSYHHLALFKVNIVQTGLHGVEDEQGWIFPFSKEVSIWDLYPYLNGRDSRMEFLKKIV
jgi:hypothetical protein